MGEAETVEQKEPTEGGEGMLSLVIADDHAVIRSALRMLLDAEPDMGVVAEAGDVEAAIRYVRGHKPDILILDLSMPGRSSLDALDELREASPETKIVVLTMQTELEFARRALRAGVSGYVLKEAADAELVQAIHRAAEGKTYLEPSLGARLAGERAGRRGDELTERETEVLRLVALGHTNAQVAEQLFLSVRTVESHRAHIQQKLGAADRAGLVAAALERGLLGK